MFTIRESEPFGTADSVMSSIEVLRGGILGSTFGSRSSTNIGWIPEIATNNSYPKILRERNHAVIERQLLALLRLPDEAEFGDVRPTRPALAYAFRLVNHLEDAGLDL